MVIERHLSERHACTLVGLSRDSYRHPALVSELNIRLSAKITEIAHTRRRAGYRMIADLLRPEHPGINHKRIYRLYSEAGLAVRRQVKAKRYGERVPLIAAETVNQTWSMDFVSDSLSTGRRLKFLTVADDFTHECVQMAVDFGMGASYVTRLLMQHLDDSALLGDEDATTAVAGTTGEDGRDESGRDQRRQADGGVRVKGGEEKAEDKEKS